MGWLRYLSLGDSDEHFDIVDTRRRIAASRYAVLRKARLPRSRVAMLEKEVVELELCIVALFRLLHASGTLKAEEIDTLRAALGESPTGADETPDDEADVTGGADGDLPDDELEGEDDADIEYGVDPGGPPRGPDGAPGKAPGGVP